MSKKILIATCLTVMAVSAANAGNLPFPVAADGTTNIADCGKVDASFRNECISRARPVSGKQIYAAQPKSEKPAPVHAVKAAAAKATTMIKKAVAAVVPAKKGARGYKIAKDGTTNVAECGKARADLRDDCIRRARPLTGKQLARFEHVPKKATKAVAAAKPVAPKALTPTAKPAVVAKTPGKGFTVAKDGTTDINACGKANPEYRDECISRARPVKGAEIYRALKAKS